MLVEPKVFQKAYADRLRLRGHWEIFIRLGSERRFRSHFGINAEHVARLWNVLLLRIPEEMVGWKPHHLLDALFFMKVYSPEPVAARFAGCDEKTLRKWNWKVVGTIAALKCVSCSIYFIVESSANVNSDR